MDKNNKRDYLYIFLHIPKCAGTTLTYHLEQNFSQDELMPLYASKFYNHMTGKFELIPDRKMIKTHLQNLPELKKEQIRFVYGHLAYYGVHECFSRPYRYITFLRDPIARVISAYYAYRRRQDRKSPGAAWRKKLPPNLSLSEWIKLDNHGACNRMARFLASNGDERLDKNQNLLACAKERLKNIYFVGITERADTDLLYVFNLLNVTKYFGNRNITAKKYFEIDANIMELISTNNSIDRDIYNYAVELNRKQREEWPDYWSRVAKAYTRKLLNLPFRAQLFFQHKLSGKRNAD